MKHLRVRRPLAIFLAGVLAGSILDPIGSGGFPVPESVPEESVRSAAEALQCILDHNQAYTGREVHPKRQSAFVHCCIDPRISLSSFLGAHQEYYYVARIAGAVINQDVVDSARLAASKHGIRLVLVLRHTDCAAEELTGAPTDPSIASLRQRCIDFEADYQKLVQDPVLRNLGVGVALGTIDIREGKRHRLSVERASFPFGRRRERKTSGPAASAAQ